MKINSNGTLLTKERIDRLLKSLLTLISISLDAASAETYRKIRGTDFHRVIGNIRELVRRRNLGAWRRLTITINMTLMRENNEELPAFVDLAADLGVDGVVFWPLSSSIWSGSTTSGSRRIPPYRSGAWHEPRGRSGRQRVCHTLLTRHTLATLPWWGELVSSPHQGAE